MTPEEKKQFDEMYTTIQSMRAEYSFPKDISDAILSRLGTGIVATGTGSPNSQTVFGSFPVTVPANPSGTITVIIGGVTYNLLYK
jgi:hypothetical protein